MSDEALQGEIESVLDSLGYELVEIERAGDARRPIYRLRIDRPDSTPGDGVTVEECRSVSRSLEARLDEWEGLAPTYLLEVSSPGVERPLVRTRDFERFAGREIALIGTGSLAGRGKRLEGELVGLRGTAPDELIVLRLEDGEELEVPRTSVRRAHLVFRWGGVRRSS